MKASSTLLVAAVMVAVVLGGAAHAESWHVAQPSLGTIFFGIDFYSAAEGFVAGMTNGPGNQIYRFTEVGDGLELVLSGTQQGQPFMMMSVRSNSDNSSVFSGLGYGQSFPGAMYTADSGATFHPSTTSSEEHWGIYHDCSRSLDKSAYVLTGDWITMDGCGAGAGVSTDGGDNYVFHDWGLDHWSRYSSFFNATHGFVSGGKWPLSAASEAIVVGDPTAEHVSPVSERVSVHTDEADPEAIAAKHADASDYQAVIARTSNGGESWEVVYESYGEFYFNQIQFVSESVGLVVGENAQTNRAVILRTTDGGNTWNTVFDGEHSLVAMHMVNEREGWAGGGIYQGIIRAFLVHTTDGGATWEEYPVNDPEPLPYSIWNIAGEQPDAVLAVAFNQATTALLRYTGDDDAVLLAEQ